MWNSSGPRGYLIAKGTLGAFVPWLEHRIGHDVVTGDDGVRRMLGVPIFEQPGVPARTGYTLFATGELMPFTWGDPEPRFRAALMVGE